MRSAVHLSLATLLALPVIGCAQERRQDQGRAPKENDAKSRRAAEQQESKEAETPRRLESVTWNSVDHELTWVISNRDKSDGKLVQPAQVEHYQISLDEATMSFDGETRRFSHEEASNVHVLMDLIAKYAVDSTVWWEDGQGEPVNGREKKEERTTPKSPEPSDDESVATLRVAAWTPDPQSLRLEIQRLEKKLADLKRMERSLAKAGLSAN
jgi:ATP-dependent Clp protease ATP-binding subunit ClpA